MRRNRSRSKGTPYLYSYEEDEEYYEEQDIFGMSPMSLYASSLNSHNNDWYNTKPLKPKNANQAKYIDALNNPKSHIIIATGAAGTGKTFIANSFAMEKLKKNEFHKIIITRPMISVDDKNNFGALPGDVQAKMLPFLLPIYDVFHKYISPNKLQSLISKGIVEICSLIHMRGRSFENCLIIADEMQNSTPNQMLMLLTRIGENSKLVINGDPYQHDRGTYDVNGLTDLVYRLDKHPQTGIEVIHFQESDVERHPIIKNILALYKDHPHVQ